MSEWSLEALGIALLSLLLISAFFSSSETSLMAINRYRLRHLAKENNKLAQLVLKLLQRPDRLLGAILIGNTFANIMAASVATVMAVNLFGERAIFPSTVLLTLLVLIFSEVAPKTFAAIQPERLAFLFAWPLFFILKIFYPLIAIVNIISNAGLKILGFSIRKGEENHQLSQEELRTLVNEASYHTLGNNKTMLLRLMDLKQVTVDDIMVPRSDIVGIDLEDTWEEIKQQLAMIQHTRLPVFQGSIDSVTGVLHARDFLSIAGRSETTKEDLLNLQSEPYFLPEGTPLTKALLNFQQEKNRIGFVVDEYGDIQGLVALEDILEEVVGEFTTDIAAASRDIYPQEDGSFIVDGSVSIRELNRNLNLNLPIDGPKTLNGLILEYLEFIPSASTGCRINGYPLEIMNLKDNTVKTVRVHPNLYQEK